MTLAPLAPEAPTEDLIQDFHLEAPPEKVWRALTEPDLLAIWLAPQSVTPDLGGPIDCEVVTQEPGRSIRYSWRGRDRNGALESEVAFELQADGAGGSRLTVIHSRALLDARGRLVSLAGYRSRRTRSASLGGLAWAA